MDTRYILKKDLPFAKAGEIFRQTFDENDNNNVYMLQEAYGIKQHKIFFEDIDNFDEWFEEVKDYFYTTIDNVIWWHTKGDNKELEDNRKAVGNYFETKEEAEKYLEYLKAKAIIKQDTKGFKPDWTNNSEIKYFGYLHFEKIEFDIAVKENKFGRERMNKTTTIYFQSEEDIKDSLEKHPEEWRVYLTYEQ